MKKNLHLIQKVNWLENEKGELKESVNDKE